MQENLLLNQTDPHHYEDHDLGDAALRLYPSAFSAAESDDLLEQLIARVSWRQNRIRIAGRELNVPRLECWMGDAEAEYGYSGIRLIPEPWVAPVLTVRDRVTDMTGICFNAVLLNYYRHGQDSVSWHADDEPELGPNPVIASVSFGAERRFHLRHKRDENRPRHRLPLPNGSLLLMDKTTQNNWMHQIPKTRSAQGPRVNLTFRQVLGSR